jgi:ABC-type dipeptide/oligopeptide/nickel transport system permease subunit
MNSGTDLAGTDGFTTMTLGSRIMLAIGAMSRMKLR